MAALGSQSIASSYEQLLHVDRDGGGNSTTLVNIKDGDNGTTFGIQLSTNMIKATGSLDVGDTSTHGLGGLSDVDHILTVSNHEDTSSGAFLAISGDQSGSDANVSHLSFCNNSQSASSQYKRIAEISARRVDEDTSGQLDFTTWNAGTGVSALRLQKTGVVELNQGQLKFPATQNASADANTLDDYEEGTWTPTIKAYGDSSKAMTMDSGSTGTYTKIGQLVTVTIYVATTANGGVDSNLHLALYDLPFTISNGGGGLESRSGLAGVNPYGLAITAGHTIGGFGIGNTTKVYLTEFNASLGYIALLRDKWTADGQMICSYSYKVA